MICKQKNKLVFIKVGYLEKQLQHQVKQAGGKWDQAQQLWQIQYKSVAKLGIEKRITIPKEVTACSNHACSYI